MKLDLAHLRQWPPQPTTLLGFFILSVGFALAAEAVWPAVALAGVALVAGDDELNP